MATDVFSGNGNYRIDVDGQMISQSESTLTSRIYWRIIVHKTNSYGYSAWGNTGSSGWADGNPGRLWTNNILSYNFQNGSLNGSFTIAEGYFNVKHNSDGTARYYVAGGLTLMNIGTASANTGWRSLPKIQTATVPSAPTSLGVDLNEMTSLRYRFSGNSNGGAPILEWQIQWQEGSGALKYVSSSGTTIFTGLNPAASYNFWARGRNSVGWGPWSAKSTGKTIAGARIKSNGVWRDAIPYVKVNGIWKLAQPYVKQNGVWKKSI